MSELTKEQIETIYRYSVDAGVGVSRAELQALCRLALRSLDHAADARLGARVRIAINDAANDDGDTPLGTSERLLAEFTDEDQDADVWAVFHAIVESLKKEQADAVRGEGR